MEKKRILIVDDEQDICQILLYNLTSAGYEAEIAFSAQEALASDVSRFDLLLFDVMMPGMSGFEMAEQLKANNKTARIPIIFLTAKDAEEDKLHGFGLGADDYVAKPFSVREVVARVGAVLSRMAGSGAQKEIRYEGLSLDLVRKSAMMNGEEVMLTKTEFELLALLISHRGRVFSRQELLEKVWPQDVVVGNRTVDVNITRLRRKIGPYANHVVSRQGYGYLFEV